MGDLVAWPRWVQSGLGGRLMHPVFSSQFEERRRLDELIESGKEEGMKVRGRAVGKVRVAPHCFSPFVVTG